MIDGGPAVVPERPVVARRPRRWTTVGSSHPHVPAWHHLGMDLDPRPTEPQVVSIEAPTGDASEHPGDDESFACPRCGRTVTEEYYGPCASCRTTLRMSITADAKDVEDVAYEPKMNVTPNAVALKD